MTDFTDTYSESLAGIADGASDATNQKGNVQGCHAVVVRVSSADADATDIDITLLGNSKAGDTLVPINGMVDNTIDLTADEEIKVFEVLEALVETDIRVQNNNGGGNAADVDLEWKGVR